MTLIAIVMNMKTMEVVELLLQRHAITSKKVIYPMVRFKTLKSLQILGLGKTLNERLNW